jgi:polyribonucleotide 5'-hydroxyl-kinase
VFGSELSLDVDYSLKDNNAAIFSWFGCSVNITGSATVIYTANDTPMKSYINTHGLILHPKRLAAKNNSNLNGPKALIIGSGDSGQCSQGTVDDSLCTTVISLLTSLVYCIVS